MIPWLKKHSWLAAILAGMALLGAVAAATLPGTIEGGTEMSAKDAAPQVAVPRVNGPATGVTETATFAMG